MKTLSISFADDAGMILRLCLLSLFCLQLTTSLAHSIGHRSAPVAVLPVRYRCCSSWRSAASAVLWDKLG